MPAGSGGRYRAAVAVLAAAALWLTAGAASAAPPGNNGTVKVNGVGLDDGPANEPHQGCSFEIQFFGYDYGSGLFATYSLDGQPPSTPGVVDYGSVFIGGDAAGGANDLDATAFVDVTGTILGDAHMKLTVHADGSQGADTKHKTFWVTCEDDGGGDDDGGGTT